MSVGDVMDRLEVQLPEEILKNLLEPGKLFKHDITPKNDAESNSDTPKRPRASVLLEKMAGDVVKIYVTVYKDDAGKSADTSIEKPCGNKELENTAMQTDVKPMDVSVTQTDKTAVEDNAMQTEKKEEKCQHQQTEKNVGKSKQQQTEKNQEKSQHQQTEKKEEKHQLQQTVKTEYKAIQTQTDVKEFANTDCQTVNTPIVEQDCQTDVAELIASLTQTDMSMASQVENVCQTDMSMATQAEHICQTDMSMATQIENICQTDTSMANQVDGDCQTSVETNNMNCQTELLTSEQEIQATVANKSIVCQATVTMRVKGSQTLANNKAVLAQTDLSMLNPTDQQCQVEVENFEQICQTDMSQAFMEEFGVQASVENREICQQTDALPMVARLIQTDNLGVCVETQTVPDINNRECQTEEVVISLPSDILPEAENMTTIQENVQDEIPMVAPEIEQPVDPGTSATITPANVTEIGSQTDPVTIIIGDASFLVQKLKGASAQAAKVSRNEIEIEVSDSSEFAQNGGTPQHSYRPMKSKQSTSRPIYSPDVKHHTQSVSAHKSTPKRQQVVGARQPYMKQERGSLSCPFCEMTFQESPFLYDHITNSHNEAAAQRHKKPKGREGKTIVPRYQGVAQLNRGMANPPYLIPQPIPPKPVAVGDHRLLPMVGQEQIVEVQVCDSDGPPVLEPMYAFSEEPEPPQPSPAKKRRTYVRHQPQPVVQEPGLFEDLPIPARSYPRNRVRRDEMYEEEEEDEVVVPQLDAYEYECPHCPEKYGSASHLYTHLKRSHKDDMEQNRPLADEEEQEPEETVENNQVEETVEQPQVEYEEEEVEQEGQQNEVEEPCEEYVETEEEQHFMVQEPETSSPSPTPRKRKRASTVAAVIKKQKREKPVVEDVEPEVEQEVEPDLGAEDAEDEAIESAETSQDEEGQVTEDTAEELEDSEVPVPEIQASKRSKTSKVSDSIEDISSSSKKASNAKPRVTRKKTKATTSQEQPQAEEIKPTPTRQSKRSKRT